jgi:hypothetical protein
VPERTAQEVQLEIEQARDALAAAVDELAVRTSPKRLANEAKTSALQKAQSPAGKAVLGGIGVLVVLLVVRRIRYQRPDA